MAGNTYENVLIVRAMTYAVRSANSAINGDTIDRNQAGQGIMRNLAFAVQTGTLTDGGVTFKLQDSADGSTGWTDVTTLLGAAPVTASTDDDKALPLFAYAGTQRYVRLVATTAGATSGGLFGAVALLGGGRRSPVR